VKRHFLGQDQAYAYDEVNRLIRFDEGFLVGNTIPKPIDTEIYGLDGVGNRKEHEKNGQVFSNSVDSMNRYAASYNGNLALDYDPRGNTTRYGDLDLTYDVYGKVVGAEEPAMTAVYLYDASDRRVMSQVNGYATYFVLEGDRVLQEVDGNSAQVTKEYVWGSAIDELVILQLDGEIYHAHADALGSTVLLTDETGEIVERYDYNPFGACVATDVNGGGLVDNPYRFTGRWLDSETGLYYYRARHYSTEMGRFLSRDPIGIWGDAGNFGNAYAYAGNNTFTYIDPTGKEITVYYRTGEGREKKEKAGHAIVHVVERDADGNVVNEKTLDAYPRHGNNADFAHVTDKPQRTKKDMNSFKAVTFETTKEQEKAAIKEIDEIKDEEQEGESKYNSLSNNCVQNSTRVLNVANDALTESVGNGNGAGKIYFRDVRRPSVLGKDMESKQNHNLHSEKTRERIRKDVEKMLIEAKEIANKHLSIGKMAQLEKMGAFKYENRY